MTTGPANPDGTPTAPAGVNPRTGEVEDREALDAVRADEPPDRIPFAAFLQDHLRGVLHGELTDGLAEVVDGVRTYRKAGELVLKIKVKPEGTASVTVVHDVAVKAPVADPEPAFYYVDSNANLRRNPEGQRTFEDLREVPRPEAADIRSIDR